MIEPWEKRVAGILGIEIDKNDNGSTECIELPQVSDEVLERYQYLSFAPWKNSQYTASNTGEG